LDTDDVVDLVSKYQAWPFFFLGQKIRQYFFGLSALVEKFCKGLMSTKINTN
jgi:hypothetical protein